MWGAFISFSLDEIIDKIIAETGISKKELARKISEKREELGGLITEDGAAHIVASELGIDLFKDQKYKDARLFIKDLISGMNNITVTGRVMKIYASREFVRDGKQSQVVSLLLGDKTKEIRTVLWGDHALNVDKISRGTVLRILSGYVKEGLKEETELHVGYRGRIIIDPEDANAADFPLVKEFSHKISELEEILSIIPVYQVEEKARKIQSFIAQFEIAYWYIGEAERRNDKYLLNRAATDLVLFGGRLILAHNEILFPFHKLFMNVLEKAPQKPVNLLRLINSLVNDPNSQTAKEFYDCVKNFKHWKLRGLPGTQYMLDTEWAWIEGKPYIGDI